MRSGFILAQLALWTSSAYAFYPFTPKWLEELDEKRDLESRNDAAAANGGGITLGVKRRGSQLSTTSPRAAAREASRLASKYENRSPSPGADSHGTVTKRDNQYNIMEADDPNQHLSAGIDQDGADYSYFIEVKLGSDDKKYYMLLDTGAGSSWVMGSDCTSKACALHSSFGPDDSKTYKASGKSFSVAYGSGNVKGELVTDSIGVAGMSFDFKFGVTSQASDDFIHFAFDGILGLSMNGGSGDNFLDALGKTGDVDGSVFAVSLHRASDSSSNDGEIKFGAPDKDKYTGDITYVDIDSEKNDWSVDLDDISYAGTSSNAGGVPAYVDTGTTFIFGPKSLVKSFHSVIPGASSSDGMSYTVPCDSDAPLKFTFAGQAFAVSPDDWISPPNGAGECTSNIYGQEVVKGSWLLGATFIKNVYTVFDKDKRRIGFAQHAEDDDETTTTSSGVSSTISTAPTATSELEDQSNQNATMTSMPSLGAGGPTSSEGAPTSGSEAKSTGSADSDSSSAIAFSFSKLAFSVCIAIVFTLAA